MKKPSKPVNPKKRFETSISDWSVQELVNFCINCNIYLEDARIEHLEDDYYGGIVQLYWYGKTYSQEQFDKKLNDYKLKKEQYDKWFKENEEYIKKSLEEANNKKKEKELTRLLKAKEKIEKMLTKYDSL
jgi:hypothetical protein